MAARSDFSSGQEVLATGPHSRPDAFPGTECSPGPSSDFTDNPVLALSPQIVLPVLGLA